MLSLAFVALALTAPTAATDSTTRKCNLAASLTLMSSF
jgi:hypothetical protein